MDRDMLSGQVALVTGAGRGIGKACATAFAEHGADVAIIEIDEATAKSAAKEIAEKTGRRVIGIQADISNEPQVKTAVQKVMEELGGVDILLNNAGICYLTTEGWEEDPGKVLEISEEQWNRTMDINIKGPVYLIRAVHDYMAAQHYGRIISISSEAGRHGGQVVSPEYGISKAGVIVLSKRLAIHYGKEGITVNNIAPGSIQSDMTVDMHLEQFDIPAGRIGTGEDIANAAVFLASRDAGFINGVTLDVGGGAYID